MFRYLVACAVVIVVALSLASLVGATTASPHASDPTLSFCGACTKDDDCGTDHKCCKSNCTGGKKKCLKVDVCPK